VFRDIEKAAIYTGRFLKPCESLGLQYVSLRHTVLFTLFFMPMVTLKINAGGVRSLFHLWLNGDPLHNPKNWESDFMERE
jgi:hypothetical protein